MRTRARMRNALVPTVAVLGLVGALVATGPVRGQEEVATNNLSVPVIWSDGKTMTLPGVYGAPVFGGTPITIDGVKYYENGDPANQWQAQTLTSTPATPVDVSFVDWGDNLESRAWSTKAQIRVETTLRQNLTSPMTGFTMKSLGGVDKDEIWGTDTKTYDASLANPGALVYSGAARLTIQQLTKPAADAKLTWNPSTDLWEGDALAPTFNSGAWADYGAEINASGGIVYGYNWKPTVGGYYRITFSLESDNAVSGVTLNTHFDTTQIFASAEETETVTKVKGGTTAGGGVAAVDVANDLSYIDLTVLNDAGVLPTPVPVPTAVPAPSSSDGGGGGGGDDGGSNDGGSSARPAPSPTRVEVAAVKAPSRYWSETSDGRITIAAPGRSPVTLDVGTVSQPSNQWCGRETVYRSYIRLDDVGIAGATFGVGSGGSLEWIPPADAGCVDWTQVDASRNFPKEVIMQFKLSQPASGALLWVLDGNDSQRGQLYEVDSNRQPRHITGAHWQANQERFRLAWGNVLPVSWEQMQDFVNRGLVGPDL